MTKKTYLLYTLVVTASLILSGCSSASNTAKQHWKTVYEGQQLEGDFDTVHVKTDVFSIYVHESPDENIHIKVNSPDLEELEKNFNIDVKQTKQQLDITIQGKQKVNLKLLDANKLFGSELHLQLPAQDYDKIALKSEVGTINYNQIFAEKLEITNNVGKIMVQDIHAGKTVIKNSVGSINMNVSSISGDIEAETELGTFDMTVAEEPEQLALDLSTELGRVDTNLDIHYDSKSKNKAVGQKGADGPKLKVRSSIGNIKVNFN